MNVLEWPEGERRCRAAALARQTFGRQVQETDNLASREDPTSGRRIGAAEGGPRLSRRLSMRPTARSMATVNNDRSERASVLLLLALSGATPIEDDRSEHFPS